MKYIVVNTKNKFSEEDAKKYYGIISNIDFNKVKFIVCPKESHLHIFNEHKYCLGVQGLSDINVLKENKVTHAIVGHYDNRKAGETDSEISGKVNILQDNNIKPILCLGEEIKSVDVFNTLKKQIDSVFKNIVNKKYILLAYEPYWAIGKNVDVSLSYIEENILYIKEYVRSMYDTQVMVLYGGSVNATNIRNLSLSKVIDGFMISSSALNEENLIQIIEYVEE